MEEVIAVRWFHFGDLSLCLSPHHYNQETDTPDFIEAYTRRCLLRHLLRPRTFRAIVQNWERCHGHTGSAILWAHAGTRQKSWVFLDKKRKRRVQNWVRRMDGKAASLFLFACNPRSEEVHAEESILIHPSAAVTVKDLQRGQCPLRIFVPGHGYLDTWRQRQRVVAELEQEIRTNGRKDR